MATKKKTPKTKKKVQKRSECTVIPVSSRVCEEGTHGCNERHEQELGTGEIIVPSVFLTPALPTKPHTVGTYLPDEPEKPLTKGNKVRLYAFLIAILAVAFFIPGIVFGDLLIQTCAGIILGIALIMVFRAARYNGRAVLPFTETAVRRYLDRCIRAWRREEGRAQTLEDALIAKSHLQAYQNVRETVFGSPLP